MRVCAAVILLASCGGDSSSSPDAGAGAGLPDSAAPQPIVECRDVPGLLIRSSFDAAQDIESVSGLNIDMASGAVSGVSASSPCGNAFESNNGWGDYQRTAALDGTGAGDFSIAVWVRSTQTSQDFPNLVSKEDLSSVETRTGYNLVLSSPSASGWYFEAFTSGSLLQTEPGPAVNDGQWHHLVATRAGGTFTIYTDGVVSSSVNGPVSDFTTNVPLRLAGKSAAMGNGPVSGSSYSGELDEFRLYTRALLSDEVSALFAAQSAGDCRCMPVNEQ